MIERIIFSGAGGQGIMLMGKILALAVLKEGKQVSWLPAYGAEVRGGASYCMVVISDREISSPFILKADTLIAMNEPSLNKFKDKVNHGGLLVINGSLVRQSAKRLIAKNTKIAWANFTDIAVNLGNIKVANMVALGAYLGKKRIVSAKTVFQVIRESAPSDKPELIKINQQALSAGIKSIEKG